MMNLAPPDLKVSVLLADDQEIYLRGLADVVRRLSNVNKIACAKNNDEVFVLLENLTFDVFILGLSLKWMKDLDVIRVIREKYPDIKIIALASMSDRSLFIPFLQEGGDSILLRETKSSELRAAIGAVISEKNYFSPEVQSVINNNSVKPNILLDRKNTFYKSQILRDLLILICEEYSTKQIADKLNITEKSVERYRAELLRKTGSKNSAGLVVYAIRNNIYTGDNDQTVVN